MCRACPKPIDWRDNVKPHRKHFSRCKAWCKRQRRLDQKSTGIFWYKGISPKRSKISGTVAEADLHHQWKGEEEDIHYNERILQVEGGTFTPLVFSVFGGMGEECKLFYKRLSSMLSEKRNEDLATVTTWVRTKMRFALLRSALMCMRGTRHRYYKPDVKEVDMEIDLRETHIREE